MIYMNEKMLYELSHIGKNNRRLPKGLVNYINSGIIDDDSCILSVYMKDRVHYLNTSFSSKTEKEGWINEVELIDYRNDLATAISFARRLRELLIRSEIKGAIYIYLSKPQGTYTVTWTSIRPSENLWISIDDIEKSTAPIMIEIIR